MSLEDALRGVPAGKLDQLCTDDDLLELSQSLTHWQVLSPFLGLTDAEEEEIKDVRDIRRQRIDMLRKWKAKQKERATYRYVQFPFKCSKEAKFMGECIVCF